MRGGEKIKPVREKSVTQTNRQNKGEEEEQNQKK